MRTADDIEKLEAMLRHLDIPVTVEIPGEPETLSWRDEENFGWQLMIGTPDGVFWPFRDFDFETQLRLYVHFPHFMQGVKTALASIFENVARKAQSNGL